MRADALFDIHGLVTVVTGAASGLGLAMAEVMAENGAVVAMLDIDAAALEIAARRLADAGHAVEPVVLDVTDSERLAAAIHGIADKHGRLDVVFANAGISAGPGFFLPAGQIQAIDPEGWERVIKVNLTSVLVTVKSAAERMKTQRSGRIIVTSSIAGSRAERAVGYAYVAAKAAVNNLVRQAALELAPYNVLVNAIAPGPFLTNIAGGRLHREPEVVRMFAATVPMGRLGKPDELKGLALLLASPASSFITGAVIPIDGGITAG